MADSKPAGMQANTRCSLYLYPADPAVINDTELRQLINGLQAIAFIDKPFDNLDNRFYTGEKFLDYIAYMGCAPAIKFEPDSSGDNSDFCHIRIHHYDKPKLVHSCLQARDPVCPQCSKPVKNWQQDNNAIHCSNCNNTSCIADFNWRKMAGVSTLFIEITDIFPREAIPQQLLLDRLDSIYPAKWLYFYSCR